MEEEHDDILGLLLARNDTDVNVQDNEGRTPLHIAVKADGTWIAEMLMANGDLDLTLTDSNGMTALQLAGNDTQMVELLADGNQEDGRTALFS